MQNVKKLQNTDKLYVMWKLPENIFNAIVEHSNTNNITICIDFQNCSSFLFSLWQNKFITTSGIIKIDNKNQIMLSINELASLIVEDAIRIIKHLKSLADKCNVNLKIVFFSDVGHSKYHTKILSNYKDNRHKSFEQITDPILQDMVNLVITGRKIAERLMSKLLNPIPGVAYLLLDQLEADFIPLFVEQCFPEDHIVTLSNDSDMLQLVSDGHTVVRNIHRKDCRVIVRVTPENVGKYMFNVSIDKYYEHIKKVTPYYVLAKAIMGDPGDNIIGLDKYGPVRTLKLITNAIDKIGMSESITIDMLINNLNLSRAQKKRVRRNVKLISYEHVLQYFINEDKEQYQQCKELLNSINDKALQPHEVVALFKPLPSFNEYKVLKEILC